MGLVGDVLLRLYSSFGFRIVFLSKCRRSSDDGVEYLYSVLGFPVWSWRVPSGHRGGG